VLRICIVLALIAGLIAASAVPVSNPASSRAPTARPLGIFYDNSFINIEDYSHPGALLVAGNCNRYSPQFAQARAAGAEVLAYLNVIEVYDNIPCKLNEGFYMGARERVPLWPYPTYGERHNWPKTRLADMRAGSKWSDHVVDYIVNLMREGKVDGVFLDNVGARLWSKRAEWRTWPQAEKDAWTQGNIDLVRRLDEKRRAINPRFIIVSNNLWDRGDPMGFGGERYVDGVVLEHSKFGEYHRRYAARKFSDLGHRRVLAIARSTEDALAWSREPGVTHVSDQARYNHPGKPVVPFQPAPR